MYKSWDFGEAVYKRNLKLQHASQKSQNLTTFSR